MLRTESSPSGLYFALADEHALEAAQEFRAVEPDLDFHLAAHAVRVDDASGLYILLLIHIQIMETPASMIYVVRGEAEHLIPAVPEFILNTDAENGIIRVHLIEGM